MSTSPLERVGVYAGSGESVLVDGLARALTALGHRLTVYVRRDTRSLPTRISPVPNMQLALLDAGPPVPAPGASLSSSVADFGARLRDALAHDRPDVIHAFGLLSGRATLAAIDILGLPFVQTFGHLAPADLRHAERSAEYKFLVRNAARVVATSSSHVFALLGLGANPSAIKFVPCGVDLRAFTALPRAEAAVGDRLRIVTLSNLGAGEGIGDVIDALALVEGVELVVGGGAFAQAGICADADAQRLQALAQTHGVADRIRFRGHIKRDDVAAFLRSADIVVCPPRDDSMGTVALEAMACGTPPIVSAVGGLVDAVADGMTGIHIPARAPRQLAYAIEALRADRPRRERFGRFGVERITARYGWTRIATETLDIYRSVASKRVPLQQRRA